MAKIQTPTAAEITEAREQITADGLLYPDTSVMGCWKGSGWHLSEVLCGILVGMQIASDRAAKAEEVETTRRGRDAVGLPSM